MSTQPVAPRLRGPIWALLAGSAVSFLGDGVRGAAFALLAASLTRDPSKIALLQAVRFLPPLLFGLPGGVVVDRVDRRRILLIAQVASFVVMACFTMAVWYQRASLSVLYITAFVVAAADVFTDVSSQSLVPSLVDRTLLPRANGGVLTAQLGAKSLIGPALGGLLFQLGAPTAFALDAASFALSALILRRLPRVSPSKATVRRSIMADIRHGLSTLWRTRSIRSLAVMAAVTNFGQGMWSSVFVLFALKVLGLHDIGYGILLAVSSVGGLVGMFVVERILDRLGYARAAVAFTLMGGIAVFSVGVSSQAVVAGALLGIYAMGNYGFNVVNRSFRQHELPAELLGRVITTFRLLVFCMVPAGASAGGWVANAFGLRAPALVAGAVIVLSALLIGPHLSMDSERKVHP